MDLRLINLNDGRWEIRDVDNHITVDTSLDKHWLECLVIEKALSLDKFDKESLVQIIEILCEED